MSAFALLIAIVAALLQPTAHPGADPTCCTNPRAAATLAIMPLGDSITLGVGSASGLGYRGPLDGMLVAHRWVGSQGAAPWLHEGHSGWRIDQVVPYARTWAAQAQPGVVLIDLGTNDAGRDHDEPAAQMLAEMRQLIAELRAALPTVSLVLAQPTLTPLNTAAQQAALRDFGDALPGLAAEVGRAKVVDMRGVHIGPDQVHPDDAGYQEMARRWATVLPVRRTT